MNIGHWIFQAVVSFWVTMWEIGAPDHSATAVVSLVIHVLLLLRFTKRFQFQKRGYWLIDWFIQWPDTWSTSSVSPTSWRSGSLFLPPLVAVVHRETKSDALSLQGPHANFIICMDFFPPFMFELRKKNTRWIHTQSSSKLKTLCVSQYFCILFLSFCSDGSD